MDMKKLLPAAAVALAAALTLTACGHPLPDYLIHPTGDVIAACLAESILTDTPLDEETLAAAGVEIVDEAALAELLGGAADEVPQSPTYLYAAPQNPSLAELRVVYACGEVAGMETVIVDGSGGVQILEENDAVDDVSITYHVYVYEVSSFHFADEGAGYALYAQSNFVVAEVVKQYQQPNWEAPGVVPDITTERYTIAQFAPNADYANYHGAEGDFRIDEFTLTDSNMEICTLSIPRER